MIHNKREVLDIQLERMYNEECGDTNGALSDSTSLSRGRRGGFQLPKWISNSRDVLSAF